MADPIGHGTDTAVVSDAFVAARELLRGAEEEAARLRADVDRYVRQREQEAELLVGKARRLLAMAEERAASIEAGEASRPTPVDPTTESDRSPDLGTPDEPARPEPTGLDAVLASAIAKALDGSLPRLG
jgi:hypothetical protein